MINRFILGNSTLWIILLASLGGIAPDIGHFLNLVTGQVDWLYGHNVWFWAIWTLASMVGLGATMVLRQIKNAQKIRTAASPSLQLDSQKSII